MLDIAALIYTTLGNYWSETNPPLANITWKYDEFDPKFPVLQILLENYPDHKTWVVGAMYKIEHKCRLTLYLKPTRYDPTNIAAWKETFRKAKTEIDRILAIHKFDIYGINNLDMADGWDDKESIAVGRGTKQKGEPIVFQSEQVLTAIYYQEAS